MEIEAPQNQKRAEQEIRMRLVNVMRDLKGVAYREPSSLPPRGRAPTTLDCSMAIAFVCREVFGTAEWLNRTGTAGWAPSAWQMWTHDLKGQETNEPRPGDLAFYTRPNPGKIPDPLWHVMMVTGEGSVMGACPEALKVWKFGVADYSISWKLEGFRTVPLSP